MPILLSPDDFGDARLPAEQPAAAPGRITLKAEDFTTLKPEDFGDPEEIATGKKKAKGLDQRIKRDLAPAGNLLLSTFKQMAGSDPLKPDAEAAKPVGLADAGGGILQALMRGPRALNQTAYSGAEDAMRGTRAMVDKLRGKKRNTPKSVPIEDWNLAAEGEAPGWGDYLEQDGVPKLPAQVLGFGGEMITDPVNLATMGLQSAGSFRNAPKLLKALLTPVEAGGEAAGRALYKMPLRSTKKLFADAGKSFDEGVRAAMKAEVGRGATSPLELYEQGQAHGRNAWEKLYESAEGPLSDVKVNLAPGWDDALGEEAAAKNATANLQNRKVNSQLRRIEGEKAAVEAGATDTANRQRNIGNSLIDTKVRSLDTAIAELEQRALYVEPLTAEERGINERLNALRTERQAALDAAATTPPADPGSLAKDRLAALDAEYKDWQGKTALEGASPYTTQDVMNMITNDDPKIRAKAIAMIEKAQPAAGAQLRDLDMNFHREATGARGQMKQLVDVLSRGDMSPHEAFNIKRFFSNKADGSEAMQSSAYTLRGTPGAKQKGAARTAETLGDVVDNQIEEHLIERLGEGAPARVKEARKDYGLAATFRDGLAKDIVRSEGHMPITAVDTAIGTHAALKAAATGNVGEAAVLGAKKIFDAFKSPRTAMRAGLATQRATKSPIWDMLARKFGAEIADAMTEEKE